LVFDTATRTLKSTLPVSFGPEGALMAPDGLTLYVLGFFKMAYYDVLSGTADLTVALPFSYVPGTVFIHPDGTRLLIGGSQLSIFDLTTRKITSNFTIP